MNRQLTHAIIKARDLEKTSSRGMIIFIEVMVIAAVFGRHFDSWLAALAGFFVGAALLCSAISPVLFLFISGGVGYGIWDAMFSNTHNAQLSLVIGIVAGLICYGLHQDDREYLRAVGS